MISPASLFDFQTWRGSFCTDAMRVIFDEEAVISAYVEVERAVTLAQGELDIIPGDAASAIADHIRAENVDLAKLHEDSRHVGRPIVGLTQQLAMQVPESHARWVHYGFTTYDVMDTATALQSKCATAELQSELTKLRMQFELLAETHRDTVMIGRTNGQHAQPTTFGARVATWIEELIRHQKHIDAVSEDAFSIQLGGMVGSLASFDDRGLELRALAARKLDLKVPLSNWHNARDGFARLVQTLGLVNTSLARIANDLYALQSTDIGEALEKGETGRGKSSGMPHKRNPRAAEFAQGVATLGRQRASGITEVMAQEHERSGGTYIAEWMLIPETFLLTSGAVSWMRELVDRLEIDSARMRQNLDAMRGLDLSERFTLALAQHVDKREARKLIDAACADVYERGCTMAEALAALSSVTEHLSTTDIERLGDPQTYLGTAGEMIDNVVALSRKHRYGI